MSNHNMLVHVEEQQKNLIINHIDDCIKNFHQVNIHKLAKDLGIKDIKEECIDSSASGYIERQDDGFVIGVEKSNSEARKRFTIAHEVAHFLLHKDKIKSEGKVVDSRMYRSNLTSDLEVEANRLAADLLMPMNLLRHFVNNVEQITYNQLSEKLGVSLQALKVRLGAPY